MARQISECKLMLIECDYDIQSVWDLEVRDQLARDFNSIQFKGSSSTSFALLFRWVA